MTTFKQKKAVKNLVENGGNVSKAMIDANYSPATAKTPQKLTESKGFKQLCEEVGLTDELIISSLVEDIKEKPKNRKPELELGAKIKGMLIDKKEPQGNLQIIIPSVVAESFNINGANKETTRSNKKQEEIQGS